MLCFANTKALIRHSEVLNFELLDSVTESSIHLSQVYQLRVNTIHTYGLVRLLIVLCLLLVETSVLSIALTDLGPDSWAEHIFELATIALQYSFHQLHSFPQLLVLNIELSVLVFFAFKIAFNVFHFVPQLSVGF